MQAIGRLARRTADSLSPTHHSAAKISPFLRRKNGMPWSVSVEEPRVTSYKSNLSHFSSSTPNINEKVDANESDSKV